jgi:hypothetical protein
MKDGVQQVLGKYIKSVFVALSPDSPKRQVFLVFTDDISFEFYGDQFSGAAGVVQGGIENVRRYISCHPEDEITAEHVAQPAPK